MKPVRAALLVAVLALTALAVGAEVKTLGKAGTVAVSVIRRVDLDYLVLTRRAPLEFEVEGPNWLRVYTRLWWPRDATGAQEYRVTLWQEDMQRPEDFEVEISPSSRGPGGRKVAQWRSFFVQVPAGMTRYRLTLDRSPSDTVGVRFALQAPRPWQQLELGGLPAMSLQAGSATSAYSRVEPNRPVSFSVTGPCRVRVRARISYDASMTGRQGFALAAASNGAELARQGFQVWPAEGATWRDAGGLVPSSERAMRFSVPAGRHEVTLTLTGTLAKSAGLAVDWLPAEKYE
jgi:hypothetical protein